MSHPAPSSLAGARIRLLILAGATQDEIATVVGTEQPNISRWITENRSPRAAATLVAFKEKYGIDVGDWTLPPTRAVLAELRRAESKRARAGRAA